MSESEVLLAPAIPPRRALVRKAIGLEIFVISYNLMEGLISVIAGFLAGSVALIGFGLDSAIEVSASIAVLAHLIRRGEGEELAWERRVAVFVGITLMVLAAYVGGQAIYDLVTKSRPDESYLGIGIAVLSLIIMPTVSRFEHSLSHKIDSRALEAESRETLVCSYLSAALLLGLGANALFGWWWADPLAALVMVAFIAKEGWEAFTRKELCCID
jgi:divalent metal cation (Fe/Co/Zn/Cd) transporter